MRLLNYLATRTHIFYPARRWELILGFIILSIIAVLAAGAQTPSSIYSTGANEVRVVEGLYPYTGPPAAPTPEHAWADFAGFPVWSDTSISVNVTVGRSWARGWHNPGPELMVGCTRAGGRPPGTFWTIATKSWPDQVVTTATTRNFTVAIPPGAQRPCYVTILWSAGHRVVGKSVYIP